ncbi:hypothetical protein tinsulaeT_25230 [Thalassotalea insulae]|uniref:STAS/SEC14 domain-containing protein n=1 Tax=Thalassotalea insulae TaxID=2056778 RepID=A0ABQ6GTC9_9GAMM|nr:hypothetical protein [Thalassotalea insulae]GLX79183.1 hypothetical protein tinsulaeT_25230 [Thalassotalea insulae]
MSSANFTPHGMLQISVDNNLVTIEIEGPCNAEFFQLMTAKLSGVREQIDLNNYTALIVLHGEALATPDAMEYFTSYLKTISVKAVALNLALTSTPSTTEQVCQRAYREAGINHQFFTDNSKAIKWLRQCMQAEN